MIDPQDQAAKENEITIQIINHNESRIVGDEIDHESITYVVRKTTNIMMIKTERGKM